MDSNSDHLEYLKKKKMKEQFEVPKNFHGAFTGGFSAGFHNTVGSKEGFAPHNFEAGTDHKVFTINDYIDEEDIENNVGQSHRDITKEKLKIMNDPSYTSLSRVEEISLKSDLKKQLKIITELAMSNMGFNLKETSNSNVIDKEEEENKESIKALADINDLGLMGDHSLLRFGIQNHNNQRQQTDNNTNTEKHFSDNEEDDINPVGKITNLMDSYQTLQKNYEKNTNSHNKKYYEKGKESNKYNSEYKNKSKEFRKFITSKEIKYDINKECLISIGLSSEKGTLDSLTLDINENSYLPLKDDTSKERKHIDIKAISQFLDIGRKFEKSEVSDQELLLNRNDYIREKKKSTEEITLASAISTREKLENNIEEEEADPKGEELFIEKGERDEKQGFSSFASSFNQGNMNKLLFDNPKAMKAYNKRNNNKRDLGEVFMKNLDRRNSQLHRQNRVSEKYNNVKANISNQTKANKELTSDSYSHFN